MITQNVDGLSPRANAQVFREADFTPRNNPPYLLEMHGRLFDVQCTSCDRIEFDTSSPICEGLRGSEQQVERQEFKQIPLDDLPRCKKCGSLARPGVVWFGEQPQHLDIVDELVEKADLCLVVGTSSQVSEIPCLLCAETESPLQVYPAAGYSHVVKDNGGKVAVFNFERTWGDCSADFLFLGPCEKLLPKALGLSGPASATEEEE